MNRSKVATGKSEWRSPDPLFAALDKVFLFDCDVAARRSNCLVRRTKKKKCHICADRMHYPHESAFSVDWNEYGHCFYLNPPYTRPTKGQPNLWHWLKLMADIPIGSKDVAACACVVPAATDTKWWKEQIWDRATNIWFLGKRVSFVDPVTKLPVSGNGWGTTIAMYGDELADPDLSEWRGYKVR